MIKRPIGSFLINLFSLYTASQLISGLILRNQDHSLFIVAGIFTVIHLTLRPLLDLAFRSLNVLTLGIVGLVIDSLLLFVLTVYFPQIQITSWRFPGLEFSDLTIAPRTFGRIETTVIIALLINLLRVTLSAIFY